MADYLPKIDAAKPFTAVASAAITGGRVLIVSGADTVSHAGADALAVTLIGIAGFDAAIGEPVTVFPLHGVHKLTAGAAVAAGATVGTLAAGKVDDAGTNRFGVALTAAAADGDVIEVIC